jgi:glycosyltransferase involved in cell wall biosynthesis
LINDQPLVSIIIPMYNSELYIAETINCALNQTWKKIEIIIVDDGSTDDSLKIAKKFECDSVIILRQPNKGASAARNLGLENAKGYYIQFLDADDLLSLNKIESQVKLLNNNTEKLAIGPIVYFQDGANPYTSQLNHEWYKEGSSNMPDFLIKLYGGALIGPNYGGMITIHAWLTPRNVIDKAGFWNEDLSFDDDGEYFCRVVLSSQEIIYSGNSVSYYRKFVDGNNISAQKNTKANLSLLTSTQLKTRHLLAKNNSLLAKIALSRLFWENSFRFYTKDKKLYEIANNEAHKLYPTLKQSPFRGRISYLLSKIIGWKAVMKLKSIKNIVTNK